MTLSDNANAIVDFEKARKNLKTKEEAVNVLLEGLYEALK